jgi:Hemerythrin HHE cation binding domain
MPSPEQADAISLLKADHRTVEDLFAKFEKARDAERKQGLVREICTELSIHTTLEEEIFYPACKGRIEDEDLLAESYVEHDGAKILIAELLESEPGAEFYDAKVTVLSEMIKHHVTEEEEALGRTVRPGKGGGSGRRRTWPAPAGAQAGVAGGVRGRQAAAAADAQLHRPQAHPGRTGRGSGRCPVKRR